MARRVKRKSKKKTARKPARRKTAAKRTKGTKRKGAKRKKSRSRGALRKSQAVNRKAQWAAYKALQKRVDKAYGKLKSDVQKDANPRVLIRDKNRLLLLLGECNYMSRECMRIESKGKRKRR